LDSTVQLQGRLMNTKPLRSTVVRQIDPVLMPPPRTNSSPSGRTRLGSSDVFTTVTLNLKYVGQAEGEAPTRPNLNRMRQSSQV
jgi:hypothetical protein